MKTKKFRWKGIIPLVVLLAIVALVWVLYLDTFVEHSVEDVGAEVVGARVDLEAADVQIAQGTVRLSGLQVADPASPMRNLFEASQIVAVVDPGPLLEKKIVIDSVLVHGVRFGTPRKESGALKNPSATSGEIWRQVNQWANQVRIPSFSLEGLASKVIKVPAISVDSLRTVTQARAIVTSADSLRQSWETQLRNVDPRPRIDSAQKLIERLKTADVRVLGVVGTRDLIQETRTTITGLTGTIDRVKALEQTVSQGVGTMKASVASLDQARLADYAYARSLVNLPSLEAPDISPALFGQIGLERLKPLLYWLDVAEKYMPPGLDPRKRIGPKRARASGVTVDYPRPQTYPKFLLRFADIDLSLAGENIVAGQYRAQLAGLTTEPALYGRPLQIVASRSGGRVGPRTVRVFGSLDHSKIPLQDTAIATIGGLTLPTIPLAPLGASVALGQGVSEIMFSRKGNTFVGRWYARSPKASWERTVRPPPVPAGRDLNAQAKAMAEDLVWRTISGITDVEIEARMSGTLQRPSVSVHSNIGDALAKSLKKAVGEEVARAERMVRAKVDSLVGEGRRQVESRVAVLQNEVQTQVTQQRAQLEQARTELEARLKELTPTLPGGFRLPR